MTKNKGGAWVVIAFSIYKSKSRSVNQSGFFLWLYVPPVKNTCGLPSQNHNFKCSRNSNMMKTLILSIALALINLIYTPTASAINPQDTRLMTQPAVSHSNPVFSPDGRLIAFSAEYDGNVDVYLLPVTGGIPRRLISPPMAKRCFLPRSGVCLPGGTCSFLPYR